MRNFQKYRQFLPLIAVIGAGLFIYAGFHFVAAYRAKERDMLAAEKAAALAKEKDRELEDNLRDQEISDLKKQIEELKNIPAPEKEPAKETPPGDKISDVVKEWSPRVAHLKCNWYNKDGTLWGTASGSATVVNFTNLGIKAVTSKHLFQAAGDRSLPKDCEIILTNSSTYSVSVQSGNLSMGESEDWAYLSLPSDANLASITRQNIKLCPSVESGDQLLILGYPKIGAKNSLTVTDGILSGTDSDYYITSAKIDKGNSGGAAILVKDSCYLGIPSASVVGSIESLGRILKASFVIGS